MTVDFVNLSKAARQATIASYGNLITYLDKHLMSKPPQHPHAGYEGDYLSRAGNTILTVAARSYGLFIKVRGSQRTMYDLLPYDGDTFYWPADHDQEVCTRSRLPSLRSGVHKFGSGTGGDGVVYRLIWSHGPAAKVEVF